MTLSRIVSRWLAHALVSAAMGPLLCLAIVPGCVDGERDADVIGGVQSAQRIATPPILPIEIPEPSDTVLADDASTRSPLGTAQLSVSDVGDARYHIPIWVPPGRNGMQPELSLDYSSKTGNGAYGVGWSLSGLPLITRCRSHGEPPITWGNPVQTDQFCLNGEFLISTSREMTTFHTLRDDFSLITAKNRDPLGPATFEQRTKDGRILTFGGPQMTMGGIIVGRPVIFGWPLTRVEDRAGNFLTITYASNGNGELLPVQIDYTGSASSSVTQRSVKFTFEARPDSDDLFVSGMEFKRDQRLSRIEMFAPTSLGKALVHSFELHYTQSPTTGRSLLDAVTECALDPVAANAGSNTASLCRKSALEYSAGALGFDDIDTGITDLQVKPLAVLDIDADGRADIFYAGTDSYYHFRLSTGSGFGADQKTPIVTSVAASLPGADYVPRPADINGDGHPDVFVSTGGAGHTGFAAYLAVPSAATPGGWSFGARPVWSGSVGFFYDIADLNGDHYPDLVRTSDQPPQSTCGWGSCPSTAFPQHGQPVYDCRQGTKDIPCMHCGDTTCLYDNSGVCCNSWPAPISVEALINNGGALPAENSASPFGSRPADEDPAWMHHFVDLMGVGRTQLLMPKWPTPDTSLGHFTATSYETWGTPVGETALPAAKSRPCTGCTPELVQPFFVDVNGDGLTDALYGFGNSYLDPAAGSLLLNTGYGFLGARSVPALWPTTVARLPAREIDWNADGKADVLQQLVYGGDPHAAGILNPAFQVLYSRPDGSLAQASLEQKVDMKDSFPASTLQVLDINGDGLDDFVSSAKGSLHVFRHRGDKPDLLTHASRGLGPNVYVTYKPLQGPDPSSDCKLPIRCVTGQLWVVDSHKVDNGMGVNTYQHTFENGRVDVAQWGLLGFKTHGIHDLQTGATSTITFDLSAWSTGGMTFYPRAGRPWQESMTAVDPATGITRKETRTSTYFVRTQSYGSIAILPATLDELVTDTLPDGVVETVSQHSSSVPAPSAYDDYGNLLSVSEVWPVDNIHQTTTYAYQNRPEAWLVSLPRRKTVSQTVGNHTATREAGYEFDDKGQLFRRTENPGPDNGTAFAPLQNSPDGVKTLYTEFDRNPNGLVEKVVVSDGISVGWDRVTTTQYDSSEGMFPVLMVNPLGHTVHAGYKSSLGLLSVRVDENGLTTTYQYDMWGRLRVESPPTGDDRTISYLPGNRGNPFGLTEEKRAGGADVLNVLDSLERVTRTMTSGRADGRWVYTNTTYDVMGRVSAQTRPYLDTDKISSATTEYDVLGRVVHVTYPDGSQEWHSYRGRTHTATDPAGNKKVVYSDSRGRPVASHETERGRRGQIPPHVLTNTLTYGPFDTLETITDTKGNVVQTIYDRLGRPRIKLDPDAGGAREFLYNAFGEVTDDIRGGTWDGATFSGGEDMSFVYDALGRLNFQIGKQSRDLEWDTAENGVGKLASAFFDNNQLSFTYDSAGRVASKSWTLGLDAPVTIAYGYDSTNRLATTTYPDVPHLPGTPPIRWKSVVENHYSSGGQLIGVSEANSGVPFWTLEDSDASDTFQKAKLGDQIETTWAEDLSHPGWLNTIVSTYGGTTIQSLAYHWDAHGRLRGRDDVALGTNETFDYDGVDRLTQWTWKAGSATRSFAYQFDDLGNLWSKTVQPSTVTSATYAYDNTHYGPHQPCAINATSCTATASDFAYDNHGNQTVAPGRTITYNDYDLPRSVTSDAGKYDFEYDGLLERVARKNPDGGQVLSFGNLYERRTDASGTTHHILKIQAHGPVAQIDILASGEVYQSQTLTYLLPDHSGSVDTLVDTNANVTHAKYEPFGARSDAADASLPGAPSPGGVRTGFAGDDHDDDLGLIDMRGRVYDPVQQRFLSMDPVAHSPTQSQGLNPYAYVFNNPLNWADPTGFDPEGDGGEGDGPYSGGAGNDGYGYVEPYSGGDSYDPISSQNQNATQGASGQDGPGIPALMADRFSLANFTLQLTGSSEGSGDGSFNLEEPNLRVDQAGGLPPQKEEGRFNPVPWSFSAPLKAGFLMALSYPVIPGTVVVQTSNDPAVAGGARFYARDGAVLITLNDLVSGNPLMEQLVKNAPAAIIIAHGTPGLVYLDDSQTPYSGALLGDALHSAGFQGSTVLLIACNGGTPSPYGDSAAQALANASGASTLGWSANVPADAWRDHFVGIITAGGRSATAAPVVATPRRP